MATPVGFEGANFLLHAPKDMSQDECGDMPCMKHPNGMISCWRLSEAEHAEVNRTGVVWLDMMMHRDIPPVLVSAIALVVVGDRPSKAEPILPKAPKRVEDKT